jgi:DNA-directed RNA polymerase specialized sigma24 family protein
MVSASADDADLPDSLITEYMTIVRIRLNQLVQGWRIHPHEIQTIVHDTLLAYVKCLRDRKKIHNPRSWLRRCVLNKFYDWTREEKRERIRKEAIPSVEDSSHNIEAMTLHERHAAQEFLRSKFARELLLELMDRVKHLPLRTRAVFVIMVDQLGHSKISSQAIADELLRRSAKKVSIKTIDRDRELLKKTLGDCLGV